MKRVQLIRKRNIVAAMLLCAATSVDAKWAQRPGISTFGPGRWGAMSFSIGDKMFVGGGYISNFSNANDWQSYEPATKTWKFLNNMPGTNFNRTEGVAFAINGKGYLGLGAQDYNGFNPAPTYLKDMWEYNAATDTWTKKADFPDSGRSEATFFTIGSRAYVVGGKTAPFGRSADTWEYDAATNKWTEKKSYPGTLSHGTGFSLNGKGYIVGGSLDDDATNKVYEYDPAANTWTEKAPFPETEISGAVAFVVGNKAYMGLGGVKPYSATENKYLQYFYSYDAATNKWSYAGGFEMSVAGRMYGIAEVVNGKAYIGAGWRLDNGATQTFFFDFYEADPTEAAGISTIGNTGLNVYPNPAKDILHVDGVYNGQSYTLVDITGKLIKSSTITGGSINISDIAPGAYIFNISTAEGKISSTIIKQ